MVDTNSQYYYKQFRRKRRFVILGFVAVVYFIFVILGLVAQLLSKPLGNVEFSRKSGSLEGNIHMRFKRNVLQEEEKNCTPRSIDNFPGNFITLEETKDGGVFIHILFAVYLFGALAIICDDYFVPSCEHICTGLKLQEDVAGATFMAAGSSTPEFFTSIIGVFIAQSDVGVGTIVGSAVFNILFIIAVCGLFTGMVVELSWWPMLRDLSFYFISIVALILTIYDGEVYWYEALIMFLFYIVYIIIMYFNPLLETKALNLVAILRDKYFPQSDDEQALLKNEEQESSSYTDLLDKQSIETGFNSDIVEEDLIKVEHINQEKDHEFQSPWKIPESFLMRIFWVAMCPVKALVYVTIPDCRKPGKWRKLFLLTFLCSIIWIAGLSYLMVWMVTIAGDALEIPDTVMGLTLLAAGTSVPDCLASLLVARDGLGDMAVSNSIGSNIFDILMCLGFPWLLETLISGGDDSVEINSAGLTYSSIILLSTVAFLLVAILVNKWKLDKKLGVTFMIVYVIVIALACLFELNIFGDFNAPACPR